MEHLHLAECLPALAVGAGGHFLVDIIGYVLVFLLGAKVRGSCNHHHWRMPLPWRRKAKVGADLSAIDSYNAAAQLSE